MTAADGRPRILEFGSGDGFQLPHLETLGDVVGSDVCVGDIARATWGGRYVVCSIAEAPFVGGRFDVLFSNHVIEHLEDAPAAFAELKRIARPGALFAFSVPTNLWLLSAVPAQYYNKLRSVRRRLFGGRSPRDSAAPAAARESPDAPREKPEGRLGRTLRFLLPVGHGVQERFVPCYRAFRVRAWRRLFTDAGFHIESAHPLLLYGASEWPVVPTTAALARFGICSSVLFVMKDADDLP